MKNKEKANEISKKRARQYHHNTFEGGLKNNEFVFSDEECMKSALEMAEWMIDKAVTWIALNAELYGSFNYGKLNEMIINFKQVMEE